MNTKIFVFGSNLQGRHGKGAALFALNNRDAVYGQGEGRQGDSYAIPTKRTPRESLSLDEVAISVERFLKYARANPELEFEVTAIGCGLAGFTKDQIAPLFSSCPDNCLLPIEFTDYFVDSNYNSG